jgi:cytochrome c553
MKKILLSIAVVSVLFLGCSEESKEEVKATTNKAIDNVAQATEDVKKEATNIAQKVTEKTKEVVDEVTQKTTPVVEEVTTKAKTVASEVTTSVVKVKDNLQEKIHTATAPKLDGKALFKVCASCHGQNGEKKALNASQIIQGWDKSKVEIALHGYKNGTYGAAMRGVMVGQVKNLNDTKISALAEYISKL